MSKREKLENNEPKKSLRVGAQRGVLARLMILGDKWGDRAG
jgi:hypothetical protein